MEGTKKRSCSWSLVVLLTGMTILVLACELTTVLGAGLSPSQCKQEWQRVKNACRPVVFGRPASPACCVPIRVSHFECLCPKFTPKLAALFNVTQATKLLQGCGRKVPRHFKCGSLNFP